MKRITYPVALFLATVTLNSCGIYGSYHRSQSLPIDSLYRDVAPQGDRTSLGMLSWRELFTDPQLQQWIETGLAKNTDLNVARLRVEQAESSLQTSRLQFLPSLTLTPDGAINRNISQNINSKSYSLGASAQWELDIFGKLRNAKEQAKSAWEQSQVYQQAVQTQLIASIAESYYSLLSLDRKLEITRQTLSLWEQNVQTMRSLKRAGQYTEAAVSQAEANRLNVESSALAIEQQIRELENTLSTLVGIPPQSIHRGVFTTLSFPEEVSIGIPLQMVNRRPDVRQAEYALAKSLYATQAARGAFYPSITLSGGLGWTNSAGGAIVNPAQWVANAVGSLTEPLFNQGKIRTNLKIAKLQQQEALLNYTQSLLDAGAEVNNALTRWQTAQQKIKLTTQQITVLTTALRSTQLLMKHGTTNYLEVLTAQQSLLQAQLTDVTNQYEQTQGVIQLYHALGGGIE